MRRQLDLEERKIIELLVKQNLSNVKIARTLDRNVGCIRNEILKNTIDGQDYNAEKAQFNHETKKKLATEKCVNTRGKLDIWKYNKVNLTERVKSLEMQVEILFEIIKQMRES